MLRAGGRFILTNCNATSRFRHYYLFSEQHHNMQCILYIIIFNSGHLEIFSFILNSTLDARELTK